MALPGLRSHRKFKRACIYANVPEAHLLGHLQMLWDTGWDRLSPVIGDATDVEICAGWVGTAGTLANALVVCGGAVE